MDHVAKEKQIVFQEFQENLQSLSTCVLSLLGCYSDDFDRETIEIHEKLKMAFKYLLDAAPCAFCFAQLLCGNF